MLAVPVPIHIRAASLADVSTLTSLLNQLIETSRVPGLEAPLSHAAFAAQFLIGPQVLSCFVAEDEATKAVWGFQTLARGRDLLEDWGDIVTFSRLQPKMPPIGAALFSGTLARARELGLGALNATIRADDRRGMAYYDKIGFETYRVVKAVPDKDGMLVDRIAKRYLVW